MTPLPNLPTDSLYKFIAVAGIALIIAGTFTSHQGERLAMEVQQSVRVNRWQWNQMQEEVDGYRKAIDTIARSIPHNDVPADPADNLSPEYSIAAQAKVDELTTKLTTRFSDSHPLYNQLETSILNARFAGRYRDCGPIMIGAGVICMACVFCLWYVKIQRYVDRRLRMESDPK